MNHRHLPAGPALQGTVGPSSASSGEMPTGPSHGGGGGGAGGGRGRRGHPHFAHQQQYHHPQPMQHYANYMPPYPTQQYYPPVHPHPQYQNGVVQSPAYMPYQPPYGRSPPPMQPQYVPMVGVSVQQPYSRHSQNSPILSTPYQPPPVPAPIPPHTPSSTTSAQLPPAAMTPPVPRAVEVATIPQEPRAVPQSAPPPAVAARPRFRAPLPWLSNPDEPFPTKAPKKSRRRPKQPMASGATVELPVEQYDGAAAMAASNLSTATTEAKSEIVDKAASETTATPSTQASEVASVATDVKTSRKPAADVGAAAPSTPQPAQPTPASVITATPTRTTPASATKLPSRPAVPALPVVQKSGPKGSKTPTSEAGEGRALEAGPELQTNDASVSHAENAAQADSTSIVPEAAASSAPVQSPTPQKPKSWASLLARSHVPRGAVPSSASSVSSAHGGAAVAASPLQNGGSTMFPRGSDSLAEALRAYRVDGAGTISHIEPRGLTNGGNMCYMNSVLQVLLYCAPFYDFLDYVSKKAVHSFKSETPLIDAMIVFMREFRVLGSAPSVEQLQAIIKGKDKSYGDPLTPNFLYDEMKRSKWFATLEQGHQQDAEEFLGWLLQALDDECSKVMGVGETTTAPGSSQGTATAPSSDKGDAGDDWLEVGPRQKAVITRSSGSTSSSPISKIFGGLLRSEFRVPGLKPSITTEPYQPLQLDIGAPHVRNIIDAMKGLTSQEKLQGDFNAQRGKNVEAFKQVLIDELPPVLILHLKRFQFDTAGGTLKIAKKIGYPLELDIPREVLSRQKVASLGGKLPKYKLFAVVYHHGKNASVGHYTVDVRRQDGAQWIRIDDTKIEPVRAEDVARGGSEEETPRDMRRDVGANGGPGNRFGAMNDEDASEDGWKQVPSSASGGAKRWSNVANGSPKPGAKNKPLQEVGNEKSVAYILFYQRV